MATCGLRIWRLQWGSGKKRENDGRGEKKGAGRCRTKTKSNLECMHSMVGMDVKVGQVRRVGPLAHQEKGGPG